MVRFVLSLVMVLLATFTSSKKLNRSDDGPLHLSTYYESKFESWITQFGIKFRDEFEYEARLQIFADNSDMIERHNEANDGSKYTLGHNEFSHLTWDEFKSTHFGYKSRRKSNPINDEKGVMEKDTRVTSRHRFLSSGPPDSVDWVADGAVTPVQNQGMCGSCWAFSAIGAMEAAYFMETEALMKFSEEQLVDCDKKDSGCLGGDMGQAFDWIKVNGGVCMEDDYPYDGIWPLVKTCATTCDVVEGTEVKEWKQVDPTYEALMTAVADVGPIAIAIEADQMEFQFYKDGVFTAACGTNLDHGVLVVGYGTVDEGTDFWKVKNSWGYTWGMDGYVLLERANSEEAQGGECGLLIEATYPVLGKGGLSSEQAFAVAPRGHGRVADREEFESSAVATDCGKGSSEIVFDHVTISPTSPTRGEPVSMMAMGTLTTPMNSGNYNLSVKLGSSSVYKHKGSLCGDSEANLPLGLGKITLHGLSCPAAPGPVTFSLEVTLPSIAPPGDYEISLVGTDATGSSALCLDVKLGL